MLLAPGWSHEAGGRQLKRARPRNPSPDHPHRTIPEVPYPAGQLGWGAPSSPRDVVLGHNHLASYARLARGAMTSRPVIGDLCPGRSGAAHASPPHSVAAWRRFLLAATGQRCFQWPPTMVYGLLLTSGASGQRGSPSRATRG
jgi:hypothetical protein